MSVVPSGSLSLTLRGKRAALASTHNMPWQNAVGIRINRIRQSSKTMSSDSLRNDILKGADEWIRDQWQDQGVTCTTNPEVIREAPTSVVLRISTGSGAYFFKAVPPILEFEPRVTKLLSTWWPDYLPQIAAVDIERRWLLMQDGGTMLRELKDKDKVLKHWQSILPTYAELQLESASKVDELLAVGCLDRRLKHLPNQLRELVEDARILRVGEPDGLLVEERTQLFNSIPAVEHACQRLNDFGVPETLHNDDFHDANIFIGERGPRFFDWGEACVA